MDKSVPDIPDSIYINNAEQLQVLLEPMRHQILLLLIQKPMTGAQLARVLKTSRARIHYHLKLLENAGMILLYEEISKKGLTEKYYRSIGRAIAASPLLSKIGQGDSAEPQTISLFQALVKFLVRTLQNACDVLLSLKNIRSVTEGWYYDDNQILTPEQYEILKKRLSKIRRDLHHWNKENTQRLQSGEKFPALNTHGTFYLSILENIGEGQVNHQPGSPVVGDDSPGLQDTSP